MKKYTINHLPKPNRPNANALHIWQIPLSEEPAWAFELLNEAEKARALRFYFPRHRRRFTVARAMLRVLLSHVLGIPAKTLHFETHTHGKPYLTDDPTLSFNLSHSREHALIAIGHSHPLGVDLECFSKRPYMGLAQQMFSLEEQHALSLLPDALKPLGFFNAWSQKEAFIKAIGLGLSYPTASFTVPLLPSTPTHLTDNQNRHWHMHAFMPFLGCSAALCCHPEVSTLSLTTLTTLTHVDSGSVL